MKIVEKIKYVVTFPFSFVAQLNYDEWKDKNKS